MQTGLTGKVALVVGGGTGIGRATAVAFAREGAAVVVAGRRDRPLSEVVDLIGSQGGRARAVITDASDPDDVVRAVAAGIDGFGGLDAVANCAGVVDREETLLTGTVADFDRVIEVNLRGSWLVLRAAGQAMVNLGRPGAMVTVSSINALRPGTVDYSTSKAGVEGLTRAAAAVLGPHGIRVNALRPGFIDTEMLRYAWDVPPEVPFPIGPSGAGERAARSRGSALGGRPGHRLALFVVCVICHRNLPRRRRRSSPRLTRKLPSDARPRVGTTPGHDDVRVAVRGQRIPVHRTL
jgi:NAD(P)-dependent dehydrogenase (short-subunit alcohol dehydrogenase family)